MSGNIQSYYSNIHQYVTYHIQHDRFAFQTNFSELASHISQVATYLLIYFPQMLDNQLQPNQIFSRHFGVVKFIPRQLRKKKISRLEVLSDVPSFHQKARPCLSIAQPGGALLLSNIFKAFKVKITQQGRLYFSPLGLFLFSRHSMSLISRNIKI